MSSLTVTSPASPRSRMLCQMRSASSWRPGMIAVPPSRPCKAGDGTRGRPSCARRFAMRAGSCGFAPGGGSSEANRLSRSRRFTGVWHRGQDAGPPATGPKAGAKQRGQMNARAEMALR